LRFIDRVIGKTPGDGQSRMKISCLMGTYGRHELLKESLTCFLQQTALEHATLLIFNQHPIPLSFEHPRVRIVNEQLSGVSLRQIKRRMVELRDPEAEFVHWWDDDDLFMPWHLEDCLAHINGHVCWRPQKSWQWFGDNRYVLRYNWFESTWLFRANVFETSPIDTHPTYLDDPVMAQMLEAGLVKMEDMGDFASYIHRWATGATHLSTYTHKGLADAVDSVNRVRGDAEGATTTGELHPVDLIPRWLHFLGGVRNLVTPEGHAELTRRLLAPAGSAP
jgi:hypothetical protein